MPKNRSKKSKSNVRQVTRSLNLLGSKTISVTVSKQTQRRFYDIPKEALEKVQSYRSKITRPAQVVSDPFRTTIAPRIKERL